MTRPPAPAALVRGRARTVRREPWGSLDWIANEALTKTRGMTLGSVVIKAGQSNPPHRHPNCDEVLLLVSGRLTHWIGRKAIRMGPGDALVIPRAAVHHARALGRKDAVMIVAYNAGRRAFRLATGA